MYGYVYETTCLVNGKKYIGQHKSDHFDTKYYGSGTLFSRALHKYGKDNFVVKILKECNSAEELNLWEQHFISESNAVDDDDFYNLVNFGVQCKFSALTRYKMSKAASERSKSPEFKQRMSELHRGKTIPADVIAKRSETLKAHNIKYGVKLRGYKHSPETRQHMADSRRGLKRSESTKLKMSKSLKEAFVNRDQSGDKNPFYGRHHTEDTLQKLRDANLGTTVVNDGVVNKRIRRDELDEYLRIGFKHGLITKKQERVWISNGLKSKLICAADLNSWILKGWHQGRK